MSFRLPGGEPLFTLLLELTSRMNEEQLPVRIIGGLAMYFWHREQDGRPRTTADIDCAFPATEWPTLEEARPRILAVDRILREIGLEPDRNEHWKASRTSRFTYLTPGEEPRIEILCGELSFGERSRRTPAWKLPVEGPHGPLYASRLEGLDLVPAWRSITIESEGRLAELQIPGLPGMMLLKQKAVIDKLERYDEEKKPEKRDHECARLVRHAEDLIALVTWARTTPGVLADFGALSRSSPTVTAHSRALRSRLQIEAPPAPLEELFDRLRAVAVDL
jgi:hypothetical protein